MPEPGPSIDLTHCDREPIHIPGSIQPHGVLLVVDPAQGTVLQAAGETVRLWGAGPEAMLGRAASELLGTNIGGLLRSRTAAAFQAPRYLGSIRAAAHGPELDCIAHMRDGVMLAELEPASAQRSTAAQALAAIGAVTASLEAAADLRQLCQIAAREVRNLTGFDRVMIYQFLEDGAGRVFAEDKAAELPAFLHHHYPASDIPKQARELYRRNTIRVIPDVDYRPAPVVPQRCTATGQPLDMSDCVLRSVSPVHIQYLKNMGVAASMSVSILRDGALWGLIACHHTAPKLVPYEQREICRHVGQILSQQVKAREEVATIAASLRLRAAHDDFVALIATADGVEDALIEHRADLRAVVPSDGAAIVCRDRVFTEGYAPSAAQIGELAHRLLNDSLPDPFATDRLSELHGPASSYSALASGLLATVVSRDDPLVLLWFRAEQVETVNWAGNPHKPAEPGARLGTLNPRKSFDLWQETVRGRSRPWSPAELKAAGGFRDAVFDLRQRQQIRELNQQLRQTLSDKESLLAQKDLLMREVNHRVQNSLQLVSSLLKLQARETTDPDVRAQFEEAQRRLVAVSMVHQRLWQSNQIESVNIERYLGQLRDGLVQSWGAAWDEHIRVHAAPAVVPTSQAVTIALVVTELVTNAVKYAYEGRVGPIDVTVKPEGQQTLRISVADRGTGMKQGRSEGFGSRLIHALVKQLGGEADIADNAPGTRVMIKVPLVAH